MQSLHILQNENVRDAGVQKLGRIGKERGVEEAGSQNVADHFQFALATTLGGFVVHLTGGDDGDDI
jgi:hypothetical protein